MRLILVLFFTFLGILFSFAQNKGETYNINIKNAKKVELNKSRVTIKKANQVIFNNTSKPLEQKLTIDSFDVAYSITGDYYTTYYFRVVDNYGVPSVRFLINFNAPFLQYGDLGYRVYSTGLSTFTNAIGVDKKSIKITGQLGTKFSLVFKSISPLFIVYTEGIEDLIYNWNYIPFHKNRDVD